MKSINKPTYLICLKSSNLILSKCTAVTTTVYLDFYAKLKCLVSSKNISCNVVVHNGCFRVFMMPWL